jgi:hypothetical protein
VDEGLCLHHLGVNKRVAEMDTAAVFR